MPPASVTLHPDIEKTLRQFEAGQLRQAIESLQALASSTDERGELARLCLNLIQEVTSDIGRAVPPTSFKLRQQLLLALGDANDDDIDDLLLWDDLSEPPEKSLAVTPPRRAQTPKPPAPTPKPLVQTSRSAGSPSVGGSAGQKLANKPSLPPLAQRPSAPPPALPSKPGVGLEHSLLPPMMGDAADFPAMSQLGEPRLPDEANMDSLFGDDFFGKDQFTPLSKQSEKATQARDATKRAPPPSPPASQQGSAQGNPNVHKPKNFQDLKASGGDRLRATVTAASPSKRPAVPSSPGIAPAPSGGHAPSVVSPIVEVSDIYEILSDATPTAPISSAFQQPQEPVPSTKPRFQNLARPKTPRATTPFPQTASPAYANRCRDLLARSQPLDAFRCLIDHLKTPTANTSDPTVISIQQSIEQALRLKALSLLEPLDRVPSLRASPAALMSRSDLDHRAGYLISQIDGSTPLEFLLDLNAMPRQDAALLLLKLIEHGIIAF